MKKTIKKHFIPHKGNNYQPHFLRERSIVMMTLIISGLFLATAFAPALFNAADLVAAIFPSVIAELTNEDRELHDVAPLAVNPVLETAARLKAEDMAKKNYFAHLSPEGVSPWHWFEEAGYHFSYAGENLAVNFIDSADIERAWMNSPGHRANILNTHFTEIGVAAVEGMYQGKPATFVVQMFGAPRSVETLPGNGGEGIGAHQPPPPADLPGQGGPPPETEDPLAGGPNNPVAPESAPNPEPKIVYSDDMLIAVKYPDRQAEAVISGQTPPNAPPIGSPIDSVIRRISANPIRSSTAVYLLLAILIFTVAMLVVFVETEKRQLKHVFYGVFLLALIASAILASRLFALSPLIV